MGRLEEEAYLLVYSIGGVRRGLTKQGAESCVVALVAARRLNDDRDDHLGDLDQDLLADGHDRRVLAVLPQDSDLDRADPNQELLFDGNRDAPDSLDFEARAVI